MIDFLYLRIFQLLAPFLIFFPFFCIGEVLENNDVELWIQASVYKKIKECFSYRLESELRFGENASVLYFKYSQFFLTYKPCDWLELSPGYRQQNGFALLLSRWVTAYEPLAEVVLHFSSGKWKWTDRNRIEYLIIPSLPANNLWGYRNRLRLTSPWKLTRIKLNPFIEDEVFFLEHRGFFQNRFAIGTLVNPTDYLTLKTFYMLRFIKLVGDEWRRQNILGMYFLFRF